MFTCQAEKSLGLDCLQLSNDVVSILVTTSLGPRILSLKISGSENLFLEAPGIKFECPGKGIYRIWGGHRLWHAPEKARRTYLPDDLPLEVETFDQGVKLSQPVEQDTGIQKSLVVQLPDDSATIIVDHTLTNRGMWSVELAAWAITMMKPGGTAILPMSSSPSDEDGLLPNRQFAFWPYSDLSSDILQWGKDHLFIHARAQQGAFKMGYANPRGWMAYWRSGFLFVKFAAFDPKASYMDGGSSSECYTNPTVLEMETLGPARILQPGESTTHREVWRVHKLDQVSFSDPFFNQVVEQTNLDQGISYLEEA